MKTPDALMRPSPSKAAREARGLSRSQLAAERGCTPAEIWLLEKLEANLVFRAYLLKIILDLNAAEPDQEAVYRWIEDLLKPE